MLHFRLHKVRSSSHDPRHLRFSEVAAQPPQVGAADPADPPDPADPNKDSPEVMAQETQKAHWH